jgi:hypothetical protein
MRLSRAAESSAEPHGVAQAGVAQAGVPQAGVPQNSVAQAKTKAVKRGSGIQCGDIACRQAGRRSLKLVFVALLLAFASQEDDYYENHNQYDANDPERGSIGGGFVGCLEQYGERRVWWHGKRCLLLFERAV